MTPASNMSPRLTQATSSLTTAATRLMEEGLPWYHDLGAQERTWVAQVAQAGITAFINWLENPTSQPALTTNVFGAAPRELARVISLEQTVALVRTTIAVVESAVDEIVPLEDRPALREAILRYSREIAFSAAEVYARAAEARGAWDARLEALVIDALLRDELDESVLGRITALGWSGGTAMVVITGPSPAGDPETALVVLRRAAETYGIDLLTGIHGTTLLAVAGQLADPAKAARLLAPHFGAGPVVFSSAVTNFGEVPQAARAALSGLRAAPGWADAPRPVATSELLPERALAGDHEAAAELIRLIYTPLVADATLLATASSYLEQTTSLEATARALFIHPNTVRYRLRRIADLTGFSPTDNRGNFTIRVGLTLGRLL